MPAEAVTLCRPGSVLQIDNAQVATATAVVIVEERAYVVTAGHACSGLVGKSVSFRVGMRWVALGSVSDARFDDALDAGVILTSSSLVDRVPFASMEPLCCYPFIELPALQGKRCAARLGQSDRWVSGSITGVVFDFSSRHELLFVPDPGQAPGTNGDSGAPLVSFDAGSSQLLGLFSRLPNGEQTMRFVHPGPALNAMRVPLP